MSGALGLFSMVSLISRIAQSPAFIRLRPHLQNQASALQKFLSWEFEVIQRVPVQRGLLHIDVGFAGVSGFDGKTFSTIVAASQVDCYLFKKRTANFVHRLFPRSTVYLEESDRIHDVPGAHLSLIFIAQIGIRQARSVVTFTD